MRLIFRYPDPEMETVLNKLDNKSEFMRNALKAYMLHHSKEYQDKELARLKSEMDHIQQEQKVLDEWRRERETKITSLSNNNKLSCFFNRFSQIDIEERESYLTQIIEDLREIDKSITKEIFKDAFETWRNDNE